MQNGRFTSGSFSEAGEYKKRAAIKEVPEQEVTGFEALEDSFMGQVLNKEMRVSGFQQGCIKVVKGGELRISGNFMGDIMIAGGDVRISGNFNGNILMTRGSLRISGNTCGTMRYLGGDIKCSGNNNMRVIYN